MYTLETPIQQLRGIGETLKARLAKQEINTLGELLLQLPLRYEDRRLLLTIDELKAQGPNLTVPATIVATVASTSQQWKGRKSIQRATLKDETGTIRATWFNSPYVLQTLEKTGQFYLSGTWNERYQVLQQAKVERVGEKTAIHTARLVPIYSSTIGITSGWIRRILTTAFEHLQVNDQLQSDKLTTQSLTESLKQIHFPETPESVIEARKRVALEEFLALMKLAEEQKKLWVSKKISPALKPKTARARLETAIAELPFTLTNSQLTSLMQILDDLTTSQPMNRLLQGDVGSGKTVVCLLIALLLIESGKSVCLIAPTRILAQQHAKTVASLFPDLPTTLILGGSQQSAVSEDYTQAQLFLGTHAVLQQLPKIKPHLIIYDEQQRFGVEQRSQQTMPETTLAEPPHTLTMTATPIPRSLMLTIFSHLDLSVISELPEGRKPTKTWYVPASKRSDAYGWLATEIKQPETLALVVCPFIDTSTKEALETVAAATELAQELQQKFPVTTRFGLLHGRQSKAEQNQVIAQAFAGELDVLVTTPIVEVGVDLPQASIIVIEAAERFGLASLHQLRGRVGRRGQQGYCMVLSNTSVTEAKERLKTFSQTTSGQTVAELDLNNRGAGNLFGVEQHGFDQLKFASWADTQLIAQAQSIFPSLPKDWSSPLLASRKESIVAAN